MIERLREFWTVYSLYRQHNPVMRSARIAYGIALKGLPF